MMDVDRDRIAARTIGTPPHVLTDIAMRRPDLHASIASNPGATPELRRWMHGVRSVRAPQPGPPQMVQRASGPQYPQPGRPPYAPPGGAPPYGPPHTVPQMPRKKGKVGCWFAGCGCLVVVAFMGLFAFAGLGAILGLSDSGTTPGPSVEAAPENTDAADIASHIALFEQERAKIDELPVELDGNPVKPLVALFDWMEDQDAKMADQCYRTSGCVKGGSPLVVHLLPVGSLNEWHSKINVVHELAHVFQRADDVRYPDDNSGYKALLDQGLFQGSEEAMADCYALTYFNEWTLSDGVTESGYGYICGDSERQAIRDWAVGMNAPMA